MKKKSIYSQYTWRNNHEHTPNVVKDLKKILSKRNLKKFNHLDIGCGNGFITKIISNFFKNTTGIDLSKQGINLAKKNLKEKNIKFINISTDKLIKQKKLYDFITSVEVVEHQYDPYKFMYDIQSLSKKNGYVLITTPFHGYFKNLILSIFNLMDKHFTALWSHGHIKFFSVKTFKQLISNYKFEIVDIKYSGRFYPLSASMIFLLKKL